MSLNSSGHRFEKEIILLNVRWYLSYSLSYRNLQEMMTERGVDVSHTSIYRWVIKFSPVIEKKIHAHKKPVGSSWRFDETYIKVNGQWKYLYRAVDKGGNTIDFLLTAKRDTKAALRFLKNAIGANNEPLKINIDKSGANTAAIKAYNETEESEIEIRQNKYLNNIIEQDHRGIKRMVRPMLGFMTFRTARITLGGIESIRMINKGQIKAKGQTPIEQFYALTV